MSVRWHVMRNTSAWLLKCSDINYPSTAFKWFIEAVRALASFRAHDSRFACFTIQFVLTALQRSNWVSSICNQLTASVQLAIPAHPDYVTCVLMTGMSFISGHGVETQDARSGNLGCWNCLCVTTLVCARAWVNSCSCYHANGNNLKHTTGWNAQDLCRVLCLNHDCHVHPLPPPFFLGSPSLSSWIIPLTLKS